MNEAMQRLVNQADEWADSQAPFSSEEREYFIEKLTELMVNECAKVIRGTKSEWPFAANDYIASIKSHFS